MELAGDEIGLGYRLGGEGYMEFMRFSIYIFLYTVLSKTAVGERFRPDLGRVVFSSHHIGGFQSPENCAQQASNFELLK